MTWSAAIFRVAGVIKVRRVKKLALGLGANPVDKARANLAAAAQLAGHALQKGVTHLGIERPSGGHHGVEFGIG
jgi:hypothetical protein